jgi:hypothetical protein
MRWRKAIRSVFDILTVDRLFISAIICGLLTDKNDQLENWGIGESGSGLLRYFSTPQPQILILSLPIPITRMLSWSQWNHTDSQPLNPSLSSKTQN